MVPVSSPLLSNGPHKPPYWTRFRPSRLRFHATSPRASLSPAPLRPLPQPRPLLHPSPFFRFLPLYPVQRGGPTAYSGKCVPEVREPNLEDRERTQAHRVPGVRGGGNLEAKYGAS